MVSNTPFINDGRDGIRHKRSYSSWWNGAIAFIFRCCAKHTIKIF
ncbi:MAG: hypothetical protein AAF378_04000 [Cyanobacteria bacterium P01_A01_bin.84]